jgi:N-acyl-D-amino-acid deacylase
MRDEEEFVLEAVDEAIRIARGWGETQISHLKIGYARNWPKFDDLVRRVEAAAASGVDIFCDRYPTAAWSTGLTSFSLWAREGTTKDFLARLKNPALEARLRSEVGEKEEADGRLGQGHHLLRDDGEEQAGGGPGRQTLSEGAGKDAFAYLRDLTP